MSLQSVTGAIVAAVLTALLCQGAQGQDAQTKEAQLKEQQGKEALAQSLNKGLPPRAAPGDYYAHAQAGAITIGAEFRAHSVPNAESILETEDYVAVEVGFFGPPDARVNLSSDAFSLRINKKKPLTSQPYLNIFGTLKDPEWEPPEGPPSKSSSTSIGGGGQGGDPSAPPPVVHPPFALQRAWQQRVMKAALPEGDRALPAAGVLFFKYHGKSDDIDTIELTYAGPAGKTVLALHP